MISVLLASALTVLSSSEREDSCLPSSPIRQSSSAICKSFSRMRDQKYWQLADGSPPMRPVSILCSISICPSFTSNSFSHLDFQRQNSCLSLSKLRSSSSTSGFGGASDLRSEVGLGLEVVGKTKFLAWMDFLWEGAGGSLQSSFSRESLVCSLLR